MKISTVLSSCFLAAIGSVGTALATEPITLSFTTSGTDASNVVVAVSGAEGVTASLTNLSHSLKSLSNSAILCPNVNGNTSPSIEMNFSISGLPEDYQFNTSGLEIHAFNGQGNYQANNDGKVRKFSVDVLLNDAEFTLYDNIDIAAGIGETSNVHQNWEATADADAAATNPMTLTLRISADAATNVGCFFGLESVTLSYVESTDPDPEPEPEPEPDPDPSNSTFYTIKWKNNTSSYMTEQADGGIVIGEYGTSNKVFWEFIPTENENCYYIRNTASGKYIGSCNMTPSSASKVTMTDTPVEYYVGQTAATSGENAGCVWLSSTDCANYNVESSSARCLNKDGASNSIITWTTSVNNIGSYWTLTETDNLYEVKPFTSSAAIGECAAAYHIVNDEGYAYSAEGAWVDFDVTSKSQQWYFVGTSNANGGYQIVNYADNAPINEGAAYTVGNTNGGAPYTFIATDGTSLNLAGTTEFTFVAARSSFVLDNQIYTMPCGTTGDVYIRKATIGNDFKYPMGKYQNKRILYSSASAPSNKYVILSRDMAEVVPGQETAISLTFNKAPGDYEIFMYFDWNRDSYFETMQELTPTEKAVETTFIVPENAKFGKTRARIRVTDNNHEGADEETHGEVLDLLLNVVDVTEETYAPIINVNAADRGEAAWANGIATATPKGNSTFLYWKEGHRLISVETSLEVVESSTQRTLTAFFTPNTDELDGIDEVTLSKVDSKATIIYSDGVISVKSDSAVKAIVVFAINGQKVAGTTDSTLSVAGVNDGVYIVKAVTENGMVSSKLKL